MALQSLQMLQYRKTLSDIGRKLTDTDMRSIRFICKDVDGLTKRDLELEEPLDFFEKLEERGVLSDIDLGFLKVLLDMVHRKDCLKLLESYQNGTGTYAKAASGDHNRQPVQAMDHDRHHGTGHNAYHGVGPVEQDGASCEGYQPVTRARDFSDGHVPQAAAGPHPSLHQNRGMIQQVREVSMGEDLSDVFEVVVEEIGRDWRQLARKLHLTETEIVRISEDHMRDLREQSMQSLLLWKKKMRSQATKAALVEALKKCRMMYIVDMLEGSYFR
ncbi:uncharacterized protein LOC119731204 [Patiria miniata]|uniref:FADD n=1 Tax=Patiria miniata TaxID=46514 RepID=A0A914A8N5_PATMI|nr:uncharacterized protein LOC119731204 [Patiria miniata]